MTKQLNKTELRMIELIHADLFALNYISTYAPDDKYTRHNLCDGDNTQTVASKLVDNDFFTSPREVIDFFEKPWKWVEEANVVYKVDEVFDICQSDKDLTEMQKEAIEKWLTEYFAYKGLDISEKIAEREDDLALYE